MKWTEYNLVTILGVVSCYFYRLSGLRFEGISWNSDETLIAYIAEEPVSAKPTFTYFGYEKGNCPDKDCNSWKGQGDWEEGWGEAYDGKRLPKLFVININRLIMSLISAYVVLKNFIMYI